MSEYGGFRMRLYAAAAQEAIAGGGDDFSIRATIGSTSGRSGIDAGVRIVAVPWLPQARTRSVRPHWASASS
ncbi:MAG: hypothetical protein MI806_10860 [Minwuiales bacterium]|nr:hypothetical protein [Minwuiales bacterium]